MDFQTDPKDSVNSNSHSNQTASRPKHTGVKTIRK